MSDYTEIPDSAFQTDEPAVASVFLELKENVIAVPEGADGAPRISHLAFEELESGTSIRSSTSGTAGGGTDFEYEFAFIQRGEVEIYGTLPSIGNATIELYRNGVVVSTTNHTTVASFTESNFAIQYGDTVVLTWASGSGSPVPCTFEIRTNGGDLFCGNPSRNVGVTGNSTS